MEKGILIKQTYFGQPIPAEVQVSFSLPYPGWCKLQDSEMWHQVESFLEDLQKEHFGGEIHEQSCRRDEEVRR